MSLATPAFSIVMMSYNYGRYIATAIESVLAQGFDDWELLIVDDGSADESWDVIGRYQDPRVQAYRLPGNQGASAAYNHALARARGAYIACLDADDFFLPEKLARQAAFFAAHDDVDVCGTFVREVDAGGETITEGGTFAPWFNRDLDLNDPARWIAENRLCHSGSVIRAAVHRKVGEFAQELTFTPDWQFWIRALVAGARFSVIHEPLVAYRNHGANITHRDPAAALAEHAQTLSQILLPWLAGAGRAALFEEALAALVGRAAALPGEDHLGRLAGNLFAGPSATAAGKALLGILVEKVRRESSLRAGSARADADWDTVHAKLRELTESSAWHAQQSASWKALANERGAAAAKAEAQLRAVRGHWAVRIARRLTRSRAL